MQSSAEGEGAWEVLSGMDAMAGTARSALEILAADLAGMFPRFDFGTMRTHAGRSLTALRRAGACGPGLYAVITPDPEEMRAALAEDQAAPGAHAC